MSYAVALDQPLLDDLADAALAAARRAGASYADIRLGETRRERALARDDRLEQFDESRRSGFGLRVLLDGAWGFCGDVRLDRAAVLDAAERACDSARAARRVQAQPIAIERHAPRGPVAHADGDRPLRRLRRRQGGFAARRDDRRARRGRGFLRGLA